MAQLRRSRETPQRRAGPSGRRMTNRQATQWPWSGTAPSAIPASTTVVSRSSGPAPRSTIFRQVHPAARRVANAFPGATGGARRRQRVGPFISRAPDGRSPTASSHKHALRASTRVWAVRSTFRFSRVLSRGHRRQIRREVPHRLGRFPGCFAMGRRTEFRLQGTPGPLNNAPVVLPSYFQLCGPTLKAWLLYFTEMRGLPSITTVADPSSLAGSWPPCFSRYSQFSWPVTTGAGLPWSLGFRSGCRRPSSARSTTSRTSPSPKIRNNRTLHRQARFPCRAGCVALLPCAGSGSARWTGNREWKPL